VGSIVEELDMSVSLDIVGVEPDRTKENIAANCSGMSKKYDFHRHRLIVLCTYTHSSLYLLNFALVFA
jgi:hypothetical protein